MIDCNRLTVSYGRHLAVDRLDLHVERGAIAGLLGLNGAGKSSTMRVLATLAEPSSGSVRLCGHDAVEAPLAVRRDLGFVSETNGAPLPAWTPYEYVQFFAARHGLDRRDADQRIRALAARLGFDRELGRRIGELSGGNRRKVELARALVHEPRVLLLDEPTRELDIPMKRAVWQLLRELAAGGVTILLASHDPLEIRRLCSEVTILREGRVVFRGPVAELEALAGDTGEVDGALATLLAGQGVGPA